jgi:hypothetical protein
VDSFVFTFFCFENQAMESPRGVRT